MHLWLDVMRDIESVLGNYETLFDVWEDGGVDGLVIGPMFFDAAALLARARYVNRDREPTPCFDPTPKAYQLLAVEPPPPPTEKWPEKRKRLDQMLTAAKGRGWNVWIFTPAAGMGTAGTGHIFADAKTQAAY